MPGIDTIVVCYLLGVDPSAKLVAQRKYKVGEEKRVSIDEEVGKLSSVRFIMEINILSGWPIWSW